MIGSCRTRRRATRPPLVRVPRTTDTPRNLCPEGVEPGLRVLYAHVMVAHGIVDITSSQCPLCGGNESRITVRTTADVLRRCYECGDEGSQSGRRSVATPAPVPVPVTLLLGEGAGQAAWY
jgi:hypothetical protein